MATPPLPGQRLVYPEAAGRMGEPRTEQSDHGLDAPDPDARLAEVDLGLGARIMSERDRNPAQARPVLATDECPDGRLGAGEFVLVAEPGMNPPGGVVLLVVDRRPSHPPNIGRCH